MVWRVGDGQYRQGDIERVLLPSAARAGAALGCHTPGGGRGPPAGSAGDGQLSPHFVSVVAVILLLRRHRWRRGGSRLVRRAMALSFLGSQLVVSAGLTVVKKAYETSVVAALKQLGGTISDKFRGNAEVGSA